MEPWELGIAISPSARHRGVAMEVAACRLSHTRRAQWTACVRTHPTSLANRTAVGITLILWPMAMPTIIRLTSATAAFRGGVLVFFVINLLLPSLRLAQQARAGAPESNEASNRVLQLCLARPQRPHGCLSPGMRRHAPQAGESVLWTFLILFALTRSIGGATSFISSTIILNGLLKDAQSGASFAPAPTHSLRIPAPAPQMVRVRLLSTVIMSARARAVGFFNGVNDSLGAL